VPAPRRVLKTGLRLLLAGIMIAAGILHFAKPYSFTRIVPSFVPATPSVVAVVASWARTPRRTASRRRRSAGARSSRLTG
jgi:uncharacterized membrane protein